MVMAIRVPGRGFLLDTHTPRTLDHADGAQEISTHKNFLQRSGYIFYKLFYRSQNSPKVIYNFFAL